MTTSTQAPPNPDAPAFVPFADMPEALLEVLRDGVIDPDLGVNIVDLGFVRGCYDEDGRTVLVMTLTSPSCPVTKVLEDMTRTAVRGLTGEDARIEWRWTPVWQPTDITESGRDQLRAIGFSFG